MGSFAIFCEVAGVYGPNMGTRGEFGRRGSGGHVSWTISRTTGTGTSCSRKNSSLRGGLLSRRVPAHIGTIVACFRNEVGSCQARFGRNAGGKGRNADRAGRAGMRSARECTAVTSVGVDGYPYKEPSPTSLSVFSFFLSFLTQQLVI